MDKIRFGKIFLAFFLPLTLTLTSQAQKRIPARLKPQVKEKVLQSISNTGKVGKKDFERVKAASMVSDRTPAREDGRMSGLAKNGRATAENMYGGWSRYDVYGEFNDIFGFDITDPKSPYELATDDRLLTGNHYICAAAWDGKQVHFISEIYIPSYETFTIGYRGTLDPITGTMKLLGSSGYASRETGNVSSMTYDFTDKTLYGVTLNGELMVVSQTDSTSRLIDTIRVNGKPGHLPLTLSASPGGTLFSVFSDGYLYRISKKDATATRVGSVGGEVVAAYQSATFDRLSGTLYWARTYEDKIDLCVIDTLTGYSSFYSDFGLQTCGLFHMYYEDACDVPLSSVEDLNYHVDGMQITLSWKNPSVNLLGVEVDCIEKVYIYRAEGLEEYVLLDSVEEVQAGSVSEYTYGEQEGFYRYAVVAVNSKGLASYAVETEYGFYEYNLPYQTGFEESDYNAPLVKDPKVQYVEDPTLVYEGSRSAYIPTFSKLRITGLPLEKGATYRLTFVARGSEVGMEGEYKPFTRVPFATLNVRIDGKTYYPEVTRSLEWVEATVDIYTEETKAYTLAFATSVFDEYYLDNVKIEVLRPNTVPGKVKNLAVGNEGTLLRADLSWTNPELTAGGEILESLTDVVVWMSPYNRFDEEDVVLKDTVKTSEPGAEMKVSYPVPYDRFWYFRLVARNEQGPSPMDTIIGSGWIGRDTVMEAPIGLQAVAMDDGTIRLSWMALSGRGENGGDLDGTVTGYKVLMQAGGEDEVKSFECTDTVWTTESLPMNYYTFGVCGVRNGKYEGDTSYVRILGGFYGGQTALEPMESDAGLTTAPFNVTTSLSDNSTVNQIIFSKKLFREPCIIDTLYFLVEPVRISFSQKIKVHLGYHDKDLFVEYGDWASISDLSEVYAGNLRFEKGKNVLKIPVKPFYYNGKQNLLLSVIKARQTTRMNLNVISNPSTEFYRQMHDYHPASLDDYYDLTGKPIMGSGVAAVPVLMVNKRQHLNVLAANVTDSDGNPLSGARFNIRSITSDTVESEMDFEERLESSDDGSCVFACLPSNMYSVRVSYPGMRDVDTLVALRSSDTLTWNISMLSAAKVKLEGVVKDLSGNPVEGAEVGLLEVDSARVKTSAKGEFSLPEVYGSTEYSLYVRHDLYLESLEDVVLGEEPVQKNPEVVLEYYPFPVRDFQTETKEEGVALSWKEPSGSRSVTERKYCGESKSAICSSAEIAIGIRFPKKDLRQWVEDQPDLSLGSISFHAKDTTAFYSMQIYSGDFSQPVFGQEIGYKEIGEYRVFLDEALKVDTTKDLLVSVRARKGYKGCPFANDQKPEIKDGSMVNMGDGWKNMSDYMVSPSDASNWILSAFFGENVSLPQPESYEVYRAREEDSPYAWESVGSVGASDLSLVDSRWAGLEAGDYRYAVRAKWAGSGLSSEKISGLLSKDMYHRVEILPLIPLGSQLSQVEVTLWGEEGRTYRESSEYGHVVIDSVRRGRYTLDVNAVGFEPFTSPVEIVSDTTLEMDLYPVSVVYSPQERIEVYPNPSASGRFQVILPEPGDDILAEIYDMSGNRIREIKVGGDRFEVNLGTYPAGVYVMKITSKRDIQIIRLIRK